MSPWTGVTAWGKALLLTGRHSKLDATSEGMDTRLSAVTPVPTAAPTAVRALTAGSRNRVSVEMMGVRGAS